MDNRRNEPASNFEEVLKNKFHESVSEHQIFDYLLENHAYGLLVGAIESKIESLETALRIIEGFVIEKMKERNGRIENE